MLKAVKVIDRFDHAHFAVFQTRVGIKFSDHDAFNALTDIASQRIGYLVRSNRLRESFALWRLFRLNFGSSLRRSRAEIASRFEVSDHDRADHRNNRDRGSYR